MQQTEKYALNLIETSDVFSPNALNENAQKLEAAIAAVQTEAAAEAEARASADAAETQARIKAVNDEASARASADTAETQARIKAINDEATARANAVTAETQARTKAVNDEATARANADTAETQARTKAVNDEATARANADTALSQRVTTLETQKIVSGSYTGNNTTRTIALGFKPAAVLLNEVGKEPFYLLTTGVTESGWRLADNGFIVDAYTGAVGTDKNMTSRKYQYIAFS